MSTTFETEFLPDGIGAIMISGKEEAVGEKIVVRHKTKLLTIGSAYADTRTTPIWISKRTRTVLFLAVLVALVLLTGVIPSVPV